MNLLLDTATILWVATDDRRLSARALDAYADQSNTLSISVVSIWEILVKQGLGKMQLPNAIDQLVAPLIESRSVRVLALDMAAVLLLPSLPPIHRDPFDRMLVCQAISERLTIVSSDEMIARYPVPTFW